MYVEITTQGYGFTTSLEDGLLLIGGQLFKVLFTSWKKQVCAITWIMTEASQEMEGYRLQRTLGVGTGWCQSKTKRDVRKNQTFSEIRVNAQSWPCMWWWESETHNTLKGVFRMGHDSYQAAVPGLLCRGLTINYNRLVTVFSKDIA